MATWSPCVVVVSELTRDEEGGAHRDNITKNDERRHCHRSSFGSHIAHGNVAPGPLANREQKGMGSEYSPGTTNDD